ncbi:MAG: hypothetical protein A2Y63_03655 [Candidatus Riflebacteria bacterium RBG_13_59_9]|nr:MAG: hypothetical protein A2Y63_03655 [Candidatus Riflebacteria bacterium RBG_13_59_9]
MNLQEKVIAFAVGALLLVSVVMGYGTLFAQPKLSKPITELPGIVEGDEPGEYRLENLPTLDGTGSADAAMQAASDRPSVSPALSEVKFPLDLNAAGTSELEALPGIGPVLAQRIVDLRDKLGRFSSVEDLLQVKGIGDKKLAAIRDLVVVE